MNLAGQPMETIRTLAILSGMMEKDPEVGQKFIATMATSSNNIEHYDAIISRASRDVDIVVYTIYARFATSCSIYKNILVL